MSNKKVIIIGNPNIGRIVASSIRNSTCLIDIDTNTNTDLEEKKLSLIPCKSIDSIEPIRISRRERRLQNRKKR